MLYNIRYGTGGNMTRFPLSGYMGRTGDHLKEVIHFIRESEPDVAGLIEVDAGSYRSQRQNQAEVIAEALGHYHTYRSKYADRHPVLSRLPILSKQGNAFITKDNITRETFHYVTRGVKRLVIELELERVVFLLAHLALSYRTRQEQLRQLKSIVRNVEKPCIVAGDFNVFQGKHELELFREAAGLEEFEDTHKPTYPSWKPKHQLDFVFHTPDVKMLSYRVPQVVYSDHLPIICDFEVA